MEATMSEEHGSTKWFDAFASATARWTGHAGAFAVAFGLVLFWALSGPIFGFSDTWQLVINTTTTVMTFLMVFLIQNSLNRDSLALHVKLDELLRVSKEAHNALIGSERLSEKEIEELEREEESAKEGGGAPSQRDADEASRRGTGTAGPGSRSRDSGPSSAMTS
jgi:low affinity Fe/Cu permease